MKRRCLVEAITYQVYTPLELSDLLAEAVSRMLYENAKHGYQIDEELENFVNDALRSYTRCNNNVADRLTIDIAANSEAFGEVLMMPVSVEL